MDKTTAMQWAARLTSAIAELPDDADVRGFNMYLNLDAKPLDMIIAIQLGHPIDAYASIGNCYSGWHEMRVWFSRYVYFWWAEREADDE